MALSVNRRKNAINAGLLDLMPDGFSGDLKPYCEVIAEAVVAEFIDHAEVKGVTVNVTGGSSSGTHNQQGSGDIE